MLVFLHEMLLKVDLIIEAIQSDCTKLLYHKEFSCSAK